MALITFGASNGNWTDGTKWVGGVAPTAADDALFTNASANVTINTGAVCRGVDFTGGTGYTGTVTHTAGVTLTIGDGTAALGNVALKMRSGMTYTGSDTGNFSFATTQSTPQTIDFAGKTMGSVTFDGAGGAWQITGVFSQRSGATNMRLTNGTLDTNGQACTWVTFVLGAGTKTLTLGASTVTITSTSGTVWNAATNGTNFTLNANTSQITLSGNGSTTFAGNGKTYYNVSMTGSGTQSMSGANVFNNFTRSSTVSGTQALQIQADITINGVFTGTGTNTATNGVRIMFTPTTFPVTNAQRTITVNGSYAFTNCDFHCIAAAGSATTPWTGTSMGDGGNNSNITFTAARTLYWVGTATNWSTLNRWSLSSGGASASTVPLPQDNCVIDGSSGVGASNTFSTGLRFLGRNIDFTGVPNAATLTFALGGFNPAVTGNLTWAASMTLSSSAAAALNMWYDTRDVTLTSAGISYGANWRYAFTGSGSITLADNLILQDTLTHNMGTLDANDKNVTALSFTSAQSVTRVINMGSGTWTLTGTGTVWSITGTGMTVNGETSTIVISDTSATDKTFAGGGQTYNILSVTTSGSGKIIFTGSNTFDSLTQTGGSTKTINFTAGTTTTLTGGDDAFFEGAVGNLITIDSVTAATHTISSATTLSTDYISLKNSVGAGAIPHYAGANSTDVSGNSNWNFTAPPEPSATKTLAALGVG